MTKDQYLASLTSDERSYLESALWASLDGDGEPLDRGRDYSDFAQDDLKRMVEEWREFREAHRADIDATDGLRECRDGYDYLDCAAHDFWITRNHHGAGFWCRGYPEALGDRLTKAAHAEGSRDLYVHGGLVRIM